MQNTRTAAIAVMIVLGGFATLLVTAGLLGLYLPELLPALARPFFEWISIGVGVLLNVIAGVTFVVMMGRAAAGE